MKPKYLFFILIPVLFSTASCTKTNIVEEELFLFSDNHITQNIESAKPGKPKPQPVSIKLPKEADEKPVQGTPPADAAEDNFIKRFNIGYLTMNVGDFYAELKPLETKNGYTRYYFRIFSRSNGFVDYLFGWRSNSVSVFRADDKGVYPESFQSKFLLKGRTKELALAYDETGKHITHDQVTPPDNRHKRPAVPDDLKQSTFSPLALVFEARRLAMKAFKQDNFNEQGIYSFSLPLYDGRRRSDINFVLQKKKVGNSYLLKISEKQVAGFTNNEINDIKKGERSIDVYLDTKTFWPVSALARSPMGSAKAVYIQDCYDVFEECIKLSEQNKAK